MKILLFTHKSDIDGMGNAVLAKLAFEEVEYVLCETFNLQNEVAKYYDNGTIYKYNRVFITDLSLEEPMLSKVENDKKLAGKFFIFDHHKSAIEDNLNKYSFATIKISDDRGMCSGTSLFYEYLVDANLINRDNKAIEEFSELTRKYDTWEWKTKYNDEMPHELTLLFDSIGCDGYIELMYQKLIKSKEENFVFNELEKMLINNKINQVQEKLINYEKKIYIREVFGLKAGIVFIDYEYRNDLAEYFRTRKLDIDFAMMIALDQGSISCRSIKDDVNVRLIASKMGGNGHDKSASIPIRREQMELIINLLTEKN